MNTAIVIDQYLSAFNADKYKVQLSNRQTEKAFWKTYTADQLRKEIGFLKARNANGFDVYCRPVGYQYVLLDDLTIDSLQPLVELKPCVLIETSPKNYQVWLILADAPTDRDTAKEICKLLAARFNADPGSAEPDHVGRLPGFTNRKEKHRLPSGLYPYVYLQRYEYRLSSFSTPEGGASAVNDPEATPYVRTAHSSGRSLSEQDFGRSCWFVRQGRDDAYIIDYLRRNSPALLARKGHRHIETYLTMTVEKARKAVGIHQTDQ